MNGFDFVYADFGERGETLRVVFQNGADVGSVNSFEDFDIVAFGNSKQKEKFTFGTGDNAGDVVVEIKVTVHNNT